MEASAHPWSALGILLLRDGLVAEEDLEAVVSEQQDSRQQHISGWRLGELLVERGLVTQGQIARLVAEQYELPFVDLDEVEPNPVVAARLPEDLVDRFSALPVDRLPDGALLLAVSDPATVLFSHELRSALDSPLRFAVAAPDAMDAAISRLRGKDDPARATTAEDTADGGVVVELPSAERRAAATALAESRLRQGSQTAPAWPPLGAILAREGLVTDVELDAALAQQRLAPTKRLGEILVERGIVARKDVARAVAEQYELPYVDLETEEIDATVSALLPRELALRYSSIPLERLANGSLRVAVADPTSVVDMDEVFEVLGGGITFAVADPEEIARAVVRSIDDAARTWADSRHANEPPVPSAGASAPEHVADAPAEDDLSEHRAGATVDEDARGADLAEPGEGDAPDSGERELEAAEDASDAHVEDTPDARPIVEAPEPLVAPTILEEHAGLAFDALVASARALDASALHASPHEHGVALRARVDGTLHDLDAPEATDRDATAALVADLGRRARELGLRVVIVPTRHGDALTIDLRPRFHPPSIAELPLRPQDELTLLDALSRPSGLVLVAVVDDEAARAALYAALLELRDPRRSLVAVDGEDLVAIAGVDQVVLDAGGTYARALRESLGAEPDAVLVAELPDPETARLAVAAAASGRMLLARVHARTAEGGIAQVGALGVDPALLASVLEAVVAHVRLRRVCSRCREGYFAQPDDLSALGRPADEHGKRLLARGKGCDACADSGYAGFVDASHVLDPTAELRALVAGGASGLELERSAVASGRTTLRDEAIALCLDGATTVSEVRRLFPAPLA